MSIYSAYKKILSIPILGPLAKQARNLYHHPKLDALRLAKKDKANAHRAIDVFFGAGSPAHGYLDEFVASPYFGKEYSFGHSGDFDVMVLYAFVRTLQPEVIVETGVASGRSSASILYALPQNNKGKLYSIDLPQTIRGDAPEVIGNADGHAELSGFLPEGQMPGWLTPDHLRDRGELILGDSNVEIPKLLGRIDNVDMFYHDGDHSYASMAFEFKVMWEKMHSGGILFSDDTRWNEAWTEFVAGHKDKKNFLYRGFGIIRK